MRLKLKLIFKQYLGSVECAEENIDYSGSDLHKKAKSAKDAGACQRLCQGTANCAFWSYKKVGNECWLKTSDKGKAPQSGATSGPAYCKGLWL